MTCPRSLGQVWNAIGLAYHTLQPLQVTQLVVRVRTGPGDPQPRADPRSRCQAAKASMPPDPNCGPWLRPPWRSRLPCGSISELPRTPVSQASHCLRPGRPTLYMCPEQAKHVRTGSGWWGEACLGREAGRPSGSWAPPR